MYKNSFLFLLKRMEPNNAYPAKKQNFLFIKVFQSIDFISIFINEIQLQPSKFKNHFESEFKLN